MKFFILFFIFTIVSSSSWAQDHSLISDINKQDNSEDKISELNEIKLERVNKALKLYQDKKFEESLKLIKENMKDRTLHRQSLELYALLKMQLGYYKESLQSYYMLIKHTHQSGVLLIKGPEEMEDFLQKNPHLPRPRDSVLNYYTFMGLGYALWSESILISSPTLAREYFLKSKKYFLFLDHFQFHTNNVEILAQKVRELEKEFVVKSQNEEFLVEKEKIFSHSYSVSTGIISYQEDTVINFNQTLASTLHSQVFGQSFFVQKGWVKDNYEFNLNAGFFTANAKVASTKSNLDYFQNKTPVFGTLLGPGLLWRATPKANLGGKILYFYRYANYEDPTPDFHIENSYVHSVLITMEGRYDLGHIFLDHQLGYSPSLGYSLWLLQIGVAL